MSSRPDKLIITRRTHQAALNMMLNRVDNMERNRREVMEDILARVNEDNLTSLTLGQLESDYDYDKNEHAFVRLGRPQQRFPLEFTEYLVLETIKTATDKARERLDFVYEEVAEHLNSQHGANLSVDELKRDFDVERSPRGHAVTALIRK
jgi:hypothetical protein